MSDIAIKIENISKQYRLGTIGTGTISHDINRWWHTIRGKEDPYLKVGAINVRASKASEDYVWALRDISFDVKQGEVLGIIGKNGAGKSTLLKILSRVTSPTIGTIKARGRIASLLEVGTGFHPEMTGRENIYMNGAIMGMTKQEITNKLDEIIDFAGVERYIDTPTKRYSSGMTVRLGFAIAAHLEPEILVVDEVLAVGDAEFQKKAIGKMKDVSHSDGRTVLFVSHNIQAVSTLTQNCVLLADGMVEMTGKTDSVIQHYLALNEEEKTSEYINENIKENTPTLTRARCITSHEGNIHKQGAPLEFEFEIHNPSPIASAAISFQIFNSSGVAVLDILNLSEEIPFCKEKGVYRLKALLPNCRLYPDQYNILINLSDRISRTKYERIEHVVSFEIQVFGTTRDNYWYAKHATYIENIEWNINKESL